MYRSQFPRNIFSELARLQREMQHPFDTDSSIRGWGRGGFPAMNVGGTPQAVQLYAFAPGLDPATIEANLERGVLTISGERLPDLPKRDEMATVHINERFAGRFRRVISLSDDVDPSGITATYRDGVLHISLKRRETAKSHWIAVQ